MKEVKLFRYVLLFTMLIFQACSSSYLATPTLEQPNPIPATQTLESSSPVQATPTLTLTSTAEMLTPTPTFEPPEGFKKYQDAIAGVSVFIPENWVVIEVDPGHLAYLQSYPEDKYIGGEPFQQGDTKFDFYIRPPGSSIDESI